MLMTEWSTEVAIRVSREEGREGEKHEIPPQSSVALNHCLIFLSKVNTRRPITR
jgi:hypothetical protein